MRQDSLLIELLVEELPPKALARLGAAFGEALQASLKASLLTDDASTLKVFATPRRLAAHLSGVRERAPDQAVSHKLMPVSVGIGADGQPTPALLKKLASLGEDASAVARLQTRGEGKAQALYLDAVAAGVSLAVGAQKALDAALAQLPIPKVMTYQLADGWSSVRFVRPAHGLVALHGQDLLPLSALGLHAGRQTQGHRFEARASALSIDHADRYEQ